MSPTVTDVIVLSFFGTKELDSSSYVIVSLGIGIVVEDISMVLVFLSCWDH